MLASSSPVSILKKPKSDMSSAGTKRKITKMDLSLPPSSSTPSDASDEPASPKKRVRVQFDEDSLMKDASSSRNDQGEPEKSAAVVREEVRRAIQRHLSGTDSAAHDNIKELFTADPRRKDEEYWLDYHKPTHTSLKHHLMGLLSNVAMLDRGCNGLVNSVLDSQWLGRDESYVKLYIRFLGNLAAAQGSYLGSVLKMLVSYLAGIPKDTGKLPGYVTVHIPEIYTRVHMALRHVMRLIPSGSGALSPILSMQFPFETDSPRAYIAYTRNLVRIVSYAPELQSDVFALLTEKLVKIDVQIQVDMEDFEDEMGEDFLHDISTEAAGVEDDNDDDDDNASVTSDESMDAESERIQTIKNNISKLDGMLDILFEYFAGPFTSGTPDDKENALDLLLSHFQNIILPTYRSRHPQFLIFHFSQSTPTLVDRFAASCVQLIFNKLQPGVKRYSAAAYLASFVARGAHVSGEVVRDVADLLGTHIDTLRREYEPTCRGPDPRRYSQFYTAVQAMLYIFCFRWRDLTTAAFEGDTAAQVDELDPEDIAFPSSIKETLMRAIHSKLNPLKICSPGIVTEFSRIVHHLGFMFVSSILETNKRLRVTAFRNISALADPRYSQFEREYRAGDDIGHQLDAYFPFDPYHLPRSRRWLEGDYVEWRGIPGLHDQDESDSEVDDDQDEGDDDGTGTDED
ncbi:hypothetical protein PHISP_07878 [Aspergillus sp. HF37]|nr:hypothetical protein PHISP_07878 [Aspergillus sp. HF37]